MQKLIQLKIILQYRRKIIFFQSCIFTVFTFNTNSTLLCKHFLRESYLTLNAEIYQHMTSM